MKKAIIRPPGAHSAQVVVFIHKIAAGIDARDAAKLAGFSNPAESARRLLARPDVRAAIVELNRGHDITLANRARASLSAMIDSSLTPPAVKARIALELLKRGDEISRRDAEKHGNPAQLDDSQLAERIARLESVLRGSGDTINATPDSAPGDNQGHNEGES